MLHTCVNLVNLVQIASYMELIDTSIHALPNIPGLSGTYFSKIYQVHTYTLDEAMASFYSIM